MDDSRRSYETGQGAYGPTLRRGAGGAREGGGVQDGGERCRVPRHGWQTDVRHDAAESAARHERALSRPRFPLRLYRLGGDPWARSWFNSMTKSPYAPSPAKRFPANWENESCINKTMG